MSDIVLVNQRYNPKTFVNIQHIFKAQNTRRAPQVPRGYENPAEWQKKRR